jgi:hypothetical protein
MWKILFGGLLGFGVAKLIESGAGKSGVKSKSTKPYRVYSSYEQIGDDGDEMVERFFDTLTEAKTYYTKVLKKKTYKGDYFIEEESSYVRVGMDGHREDIDEVEMKEIIATGKKEKWKLTYVSLNHNDDTLDLWETRNK